MRLWKKNAGPTKAQNISANIQTNLDMVKNVLGNSQDLIIREFTLANDKKNNAAIINLRGLAERDLVNDHLLHTLMLDIRFKEPIGCKEIFLRIKKYGITNRNVKEVQTIQEVVSEIIIGNTVFLLDGINLALVVGSQGWEERAVSEPFTEGVVRGPRDGFTENIQINTALIRRRIKSPNLRIDGLVIGVHTKTNIAIVYLEGIAQKEVITEVKNRLHRIEIDGILESGYIEELIEDNPYSPFPQIEHSERPDKVSAALLEGRVAIMVDTTPFVLMVPTIFFQFIQSAEDYYERYFFAVLVRGVRMLAFFISVTLPALYIAVTSFHQEMIPTPLALSIAASREGIPFPSIGEALIMEATFEILREAGIRLPRPTGQAVSIVGALVIGQAAVQAGIVSQAMVIIVALTGISSFALPAFNAAFAGRLLRFPLMLLASFLGLPGMLAGLSIILAHMAGLRSFGVNYLDPITSPKIRQFKDLAVRAPWWAMIRRPGSITGNYQRRVKSGQKPESNND